VRRRDDGDGGDRDTPSPPSTSGRSPPAAAASPPPSSRTGACPVCGISLPPTQLAAHVQAELAACLADDEEVEAGWRATTAALHGAPHALLPPPPPAAGRALLALGGGGGAKRPPPPPAPRHGWAATLAAVAARPGRVDHYQDVRAAAAPRGGFGGAALGIDGVAGAEAGWEVAGASGLGAGLGED